MTEGEGFDSYLIPQSFRSPPGYKPGQKRTAEELAKLDAEDESLNRWKASLGTVSSPYFS